MKIFQAVCALILGLLSCQSLRAALLAYEPFTNSAGMAIIGSSDGFGFSGAWQNNSSGGVATNAGFGLTYTDESGNSLVTLGGAGFFQGLTSANTSMQPYRLFNFARGTNGTDGATTWISFLIVRQGPTGTLAGNPYGRGANVCHDNAGANPQRLAIGNSSSVATNTVGLIPAGASGNLKSSTNTFGNDTNFVVVRIDHIAGGNDNAWLFVNPNLDVEPSTNNASANSIGGFDFSFDRLRIFAGGQSSASQPYAELIVDEYRIGESYADVTPHTALPSPTGTPVITNTVLSADGVILSGNCGAPSGNFYVVTATNLAAPATNWPVVSTNQFDIGGNFVVTNPMRSDAARFFRLFTGQLPIIAVPPSIGTQPASLTVTQGNTATFNVGADGSAPLFYKWYFNTNTLLQSGTNFSFSLVNAQTNDAGNYSVVITNIAGSVTSGPVALTVLVAPYIATQPFSQAVTASNNVTFSVSAGGTAPLRYQWFFNTNTALASATNTSLTIVNAQSSNAGTYSVIVSNSVGWTSSAYATLTVSQTIITNGAYFVSTSGSDANPGTIDRPFLTISKGVTAIGSGGQLYIRAGTYALSSKLSLSKTASRTNMIRIWAYPGETVVIDSTGNTSDGIGISGKWYHLKGITVMNAGHNGINISGSSNIVEFCTVHDNGNTGMHITGGTSSTTFPAYNLILNCDSYLNYDPPIGGNADGFSAKWDLGPGNVFSGCRAWWNSDDGWDLWMGNAPVTITNCWAFWQGTNYWSSSQFNGNGNGFKLGGNYVGAPHRLVRSVAFANEANGIDQNNNIAGQILDNNTSWANKVRNYSMNHGTNTTPHVVRNNLSFAGTSGDSFTAGTLATNNSWQVISPTANASDVQSTDTSVVIAPRKADGSLPEWPFLRPVVGGRLVDKGVDIGEPYNGAAPDLGAFESP